MSREIKTYTAQEYRRGEWEDVFTKDKDGKKTPKTVKISVEHAELLSADAESLASQSGGRSTSMFRYVEKKGVKKETPKKEDVVKVTLAELREQHPDIKATSVKGFLEKLEESNN